MKQYMDGYCNKHPDRPLVSVNSIPTCLSCSAAPREFPETMVSPEGRIIFSNQQLVKEAEDTPLAKGLKQAAPQVSIAPDFNGAISAIVRMFDGLPMPKDLKQFKAALRAKEILVKVMESTNV